MTTNALEAVNAIYAKARAGEQLNFDEVMIGLCGSPAAWEREKVKQRKAQERMLRQALGNDVYNARRQGNMKALADVLRETRKADWKHAKQVERGRLGGLAKAANHAARALDAIEDELNRRNPS